MTKRYQIIITVLVLFVVSVSGIHINNSNALFISSADVSSVSEGSAMINAGSYELNMGYSRINQQDYWNAGSASRMSASLFKRSQTSHRGQERHEMSVVILDVTFKLILFSIAMLLFATGGAGLSMPFRCLLCYIHGLDGKKRIM